MLRASLAAVLLLIGIPAGGDLTCNNLSIYSTDVDQSCQSCLQWCDGEVTKEGSESGWLCLYLYSPDTFNVCDHTITLWVGLDWNEYCFDVESDVSLVNWCLESERFDWDDPRGSWAKVYIYLPCLSPSTHYVTPVWSDPCDYCQDCTE